MDTKTKIEAYIFKKNNVLSKELVEVFDISLPTVHKFLGILEKENKIKRIHGGCIPVHSSKESLFDTKLNTLLDEKKALCAFVAHTMISDNMVVGIDSGTTVYPFIDYLPDSTLITIVTNCLKIASHCAESRPHLNTICSGGIVRPQLSVCVGQEAIKFFKNKKLDILLLTCAGIANESIYEVDEFIAEVKRTMIHVAKKVVLVLTSDKIDNGAYTYLASISCVDDIVCSDKVDKVLLKKHAPDANIHYVSIPE